MAEKRSAPLTLRVLTPAGSMAEESCDGVQLILRDGADGRGGGSMGILRGHAPAVMALGEGTVRAVLNGKVSLCLRVSGGFDSVRDDIVTVITDSAALVNEDSTSKE